jgi:hypothetical protein
MWMDLWPTISLIIPLLVVGIGLYLLIRYLIKLYSRK